ncbi:hypothetical protein ACJQWK_00803 [Exserohilum turcicum]
MQPPTSPRLPGVPLLALDATGSEYSRWKRSVRFALAQKDTWKYCNGACPMPMPKERSASASCEEEINDPQPTLLGERRAWMRQDREVKLDIFLSLAEEVMEDLFDVGQPLPPTKYTAKQILEALDERFLVFEFEGYHHAFCHFLNLHLDQFASLEDFNIEFMTVLEDLLDYGQPLSNAQACSAYFSKLRCTENPWVAKKISEWDAKSSAFLIRDIMDEAVLYSNANPLASMAPQNCHVKPAPEGQFVVIAELDSAPELSDISTLSSKGSHSRHISREVSERQKARINRLSDEPVDPEALHEALEKVPAIADSQALNPDDWVRGESITPEWLRAKEKFIPDSTVEAQPADDSLALLPPASLQTPSKSRPLRTTSSMTSLDPTAPARIPSVESADGDMPVTPPLRVRRRAPTHPSPVPFSSEHPQFRNKALAPFEDLIDIHPALRPVTPPAKVPQPQTPSSSGPTKPQPPIPERNPKRPRARSLGPSRTFRDISSTLCSDPAPHTRESCSDSVAYSSVPSNSDSSSGITLPIQGTDDLHGDWQLRCPPTSPVTPPGPITRELYFSTTHPFTPASLDSESPRDESNRMSPPPWILASFSPHLVPQSRVGQLREQRHQHSISAPSVPLLPKRANPKPSPTSRHSFHVPISAFSSLHFSNHSTPQPKKKKKSKIHRDSIPDLRSASGGDSGSSSVSMWRLPHRVHISSQLQTRGRNSQILETDETERAESPSQKRSMKDKSWYLGAHIGKRGGQGHPRLVLP